MHIVGVVVNMMMAWAVFATCSCEQRCVSNPMTPGERAGKEEDTRREGQASRPHIVFMCIMACDR